MDIDFISAFFLICLIVSFMGAGVSAARLHQWIKSMYVPFISFCGHLCSFMSLAGLSWLSMSLSGLLLSYLSL